MSIVTLRAGELKIKIGVNNGLTLKEVTERDNIIWSSEEALMGLSVRCLSGREELRLDTRSGWEVATAAETADGYVFSCSGNREVEGIGLTLTASFSGDSVIWQTQVANTNPKYTVVCCDHPSLSFNAGESLTVFYPLNCGEIHSAEREKEIEFDYSYPSYGATMEYMAAYNTETGRGIYYGLHDSAPAFKRLSVSKTKGEDRLKMWARQPLSCTDRAENSQSLCGVCVWRLFSGDWYDAASIYREWVSQNGEFVGRRGVPDWFKRLSHWWLVNVDDEGRFADETIAATKDLGVDCAVHLYWWHNAPFDNDYPHYFPSRSVAMEGVRRMQAAGIKVMPYINGRLWDTRDRGLEDWQFSAVARPGATKNEYGECYVESYGSKEEDGSDVELAVMCPSSELWQEKMADIVERLINREGFDGVYIDQIAAAEPTACCDRHHPHAVGGGDWWCRSYRALLDRVYSRIPDSSLLTTECNADPFVSHMGGYLSWMWKRSCQVAAFPAVYSEYITMFGRNYAVYRGDESIGRRLFIAQSLCFGEQLGWDFPNEYMKDRHKDFYALCVRTRASLIKFFCVGSRYLRPPTVVTAMPRLREESFYTGKHRIIEEDAVVGCLRESEDGETLLLLVNAGEEGGEAELSACLPDGDYGELSFQGGRASVYMPPLSVKYFRIK